MNHRSADQAYADYMLHWLQKLDWPALPVADQVLPVLLAYWRDGTATDLESLADPLWAWVDANGGDARSTDKSMILARMLICLASPSNRQLQQRGYFEELLDLYGVAPADILRVLDEHQLDAEGVPVAGTIVPDELARAAHFRRLKARVLSAFFALSFLSGARPIGTEAAATIEMVLILGMAFVIFLWYRVDSDQRGFQRTPLLNFSMIMVAAVAMPYYLIRSRGWEQGQRSVALAFAAFLGSMALSVVGMALFGTLPA